MRISSKSSFLISAAIAALFVVSLIFNLIFLTFLIFIIVSFFALQNWISKQAAFAASIMIPIIVVGTVELFSRFISIFFVHQIQFVLLLVSVVLIFVLLRYNNFTHTEKKVDLKISWAIVSIGLPSLVTLGLVLWGNNLTENLGWMLLGDAQNNTVAVDEIITKNGFPGGLPAISQGLMAFFVAGILGNVVTPVIFVPILQIQSVVLVLLWMISSLLFGIIAYKEASNTRQVTRHFFGFFAALLPFSWYLLGFSVDAGFYNTPIALIAIATSWIFWRELSSNPGKNAWPVNTLLFLNVFFAMMAWTPLAIVPFGFLSISLIMSFKSFRFDSKTILIALIAAGFLFIFAILAFLPSLSFFGEIAAAQGYIAAYSPLVAAGTLLIGLISALTIGPKFEIGRRTFGLIILSASIATGVAFLIIAGYFETNNLGWTYYPSKMAWIALFFFAFISTVVFIHFWINKEISAIIRLLITFSVLSLLLVGMLFVPASGTGPSKFFPFINIAFNGSDKTNLVSDIEKSLETKSIRLFFDQNDYLVNQWVFQWKKYEQDPQVWGYAYSIINNAEDVCSAAATWGGDVTLFTKSPEVEIQTKELCGDLISSVIKN